MIGVEFQRAAVAGMRLSVLVTENAADMAGVADGDWALIAPYGNHPSPEGDYVQRFFKPEAEAIVATWNSITGLAARLFKNLCHGLGRRDSIPVWDGHPDSDSNRWPKEKLLAEVTDLRAGEAGLEGKVTWNQKGRQRRTRGPLRPSPLWWHWPPSGEPPTVRPELLESIGLVPTPNIANAPAWTGNATLFPEDTNPQNEGDNMALRDREDLQLSPLAWPVRKGVLRLLGLPDDAGEQEYKAAWNAAMIHHTTANAGSTAAPENESPRQRVTRQARELAQTALVSAQTYQGLLQSPEGQSLAQSAREAAEPQPGESNNEGREAVLNLIAMVSPQIAEMFRKNWGTVVIAAPVTPTPQQEFQRLVEAEMRSAGVDYNTAFATITRTSNGAALLRQGQNRSRHEMARRSGMPR